LEACNLEIYISISLFIIFVDIGSLNTVKIGIG